MEVLLVDDSAVTRAVLSQALHQSSRSAYTLRFANDGEAAKQQMEGVELVITDWMMPNLDGIGFTQWLRADERYADLPVIMVTSGDQTGENQEAARAAGVDLFIEKSPSPEAIADAIERAIAKRSGGA
ncbi:MAG: response regulator [Planctomycetota bacterium]|jgi:CheY-like chemotaxis protein